MYFLDAIELLSVRNLDADLTFFTCSFVLCPLSEAILYTVLSFRGMLSVHCPEIVARLSISWRLKMYYFYDKISGGTLFVCCMEAVHITESPL